jgi:hypothetical protein
MTLRLEGDPARPGLPFEACWSGVVRIDLAPLHPSEANRIACAYLHTVGEPAQRCLERAVGNPLFMEQLLRDAEESAEGGVSGSIRSLVQARLDRLASPPAGTVGVLDQLQAARAAAIAMNTVQAR